MLPWGEALGKHLAGAAAVPSLCGMRRLLFACLVLGGCSAASRAEPSTEALIVAFADDFHSGIVLERSQMDGRLLPSGPETPWVAVHFGERRWITGQADGLLDAARLLVAPGAGGVQVDGVDWWVHARGGTDTSRVRVWVFPVGQAQVLGLRARLDSWIADGATGQPIRPGSCWWPSSRAWTIGTNCHDFTADLLAAAGIDVDRPPIMMAGPLRAALDRAWSDRDAGP